MFRRTAAVLITGMLAAGCTDSIEPVAPSRLAPYIAPAAAVAADVIPDEYIVVLDAGSDVPSEASRAALRGGRVLAEWESALKGYAVRMTPGGLTALRQSATIKFVTANQVARRQGTQACAPYITCGWGLDRIDQTSRVLNGSFTYPSSGAGVRVYVIDTGIRTSHTQFQGRATWGADFIDGTKVDCDGHGTHVAATIAGKDHGVAKGASVVAVRVLDCTGTGTYAQVISGINWVTRNAVKPAVANLSLGGPPDAATDLALNNSIASGISYAVAAGNSGANACNFTPARVPNAMTVGATGAGNGLPPVTVDGRPSYSNFGGCLDLFAPGSSILAAYNGSDNQTAVLSGTSMASPHVAGAAALLLAKHGALTPRQVRDTLVARALAGVVSNAGSGSPNRLLNISFLNAPTASNQAPIARFTVTCNATVHYCDLDAGASSDDRGVAGLTFAWSTNDSRRPPRSGRVIRRYGLDAVPGPWSYTEKLVVRDAGGLTHSVAKVVTIP